MRQVVLAIGALFVGALVLTYAFQEASNEVMGPGIEQATDNVEGFAAMSSPEAQAAVENGQQAAERAEMDDWYAGDEPAGSDYSD